MDPELLNWCKKVIGTPSVSGQGTRRLAELLASELLAARGIQAQLLPSAVEGVPQVNLIAQVEGREPGLQPLVLTTHLDTVPPGERSLWTACGGDPFAAAVEGDRIYGLGAADTKLDFVAKALALAAVGRPRRSVYLAATFGEERGLLGAKELVASGLLPKQGAVFVGEPSGLSLVTAHKGLLFFRLRLNFGARTEPALRALLRVVFAGRSAHSSTPHLGVNAIALALRSLSGEPALRVASIDGGDAVNKVPARCAVVGAAPEAGLPKGASVEPIGRQQVGLLPSSTLWVLAQFLEGSERLVEETAAIDPDFSAPALTWNPGVIRTEEQTITLELEFRPPPGADLPRLRESLNALVREISSQTPELSLELTEERANPAFRASPASETVRLAVEALARARLEAVMEVKAGCTEAGVYAQHGLSPVVFGPGPSAGVIHAPNEYNVLPQVEAAAGFYRALLLL
jgi:acetylornithine deacetylase/succinyl-diaminopimelate desuccinylase-like protein